MQVTTFPNHLHMICFSDLLKNVMNHAVYSLCRLTLDGNNFHVGASSRSCFASQLHPFESSPSCYLPDGHVDLLKLNTDRRISAGKTSPMFQSVGFHRCFHHVHLQKKAGAKVKHLESSHELTAETLNLFHIVMLLMGDVSDISDVLIT